MKAQLPRPRIWSNKPWYWLLAGIIAASVLGIVLSSRASGAFGSVEARLIPPLPVLTEVGVGDWWLKVDDNGWVIPPIAGSANRIYVSLSGSDSNPGTEVKPVKNLARAKALVRSGRQTVVLLKRGDTWNSDLTWLPSGTKAMPTILMSYGTGSGRATLLPYDRDAVQLVGKNYVMVLDLFVRAAKRKPGDGGFNPLANGVGVNAYKSNYIWVEGVKSQYFRNNMVIQAESDSTGLPKKMLKSVVVRRNVLANSYSKSSHSQGIYAHGIDGLLFEDNFLIRNGYYTGVTLATIFNHNVYVQGSCTNVIARSNFSTEASATGWQARSGGAFEYNLFVNNPMAFNFGLVNGDTRPVKGGVTGNVRYNVVQGGGTINGSKRSVGASLANITSGNVSNNLIAFVRDEGVESFGFVIEAGSGRYESLQVGTHNLVMENNITYQYPKSLRIENGFKLGTGSIKSISNVRLKNNHFQELRNVAGLVNVESVTTQRQYKDPTRTADKYVKSLGLPGTYNDRVMSLSKGNWDERLRPEKVVAWIMEGWELK